MTPTHQCPQCHTLYYEDQECDSTDCAGRVQAVPLGRFGGGRLPVHTSGYLQRVSINTIQPTVPAGGLDLTDDTPMVGGRS